MTPGPTTSGATSTGTWATITSTAAATTTTTGKSLLLIIWVVGMGWGLSGSTGPTSTGPSISVGARLPPRLQWLRPLLLVSHVTLHSII